MRLYIAYRCAYMFSFTLERAYRDAAFDEEPGLEPYDPNSGSSDPHVFVYDPQLRALDDADFGELTLAIAANWHVDSVGLKIKRVDGDLFEAHFVIPKYADEVIAAYKEVAV